MRVYGVIGWKNSGKTSLMERLVAEITRRGYTVSTVKHVHHDVDLDQPGKDSHRHRAAGASEVVLASAHRFALMREHRGPEPDLAEVLSRMAPVDLILVEGYKRDAHAKIEVFRLEAGHDLIQPNDPLVRAVATDMALAALPVPVLDLNNTTEIADFILREVGLLSKPDDVDRHLFDTVVVVDWSAASSPTPKEPSPNSIWIGIARQSGEETLYCRTRAEAEAVLNDVLNREKGRRVLLGFDFPMGFPAGFGKRLTGSDDAVILWNWLNERLEDCPDNKNNRLDLAASINRHFSGGGPFWVVNSGLARADLPFGKLGKVDFTALQLAEFREIERSRLAGNPKSVWQLTGPGSVGSQTLTGLPVIARLARRPEVAVWPFQPVAHHSIVVAEVYPSLLTNAVKHFGDQIKDRAQVFLLARALLRLSRTGRLTPLFDVPAMASIEGWILGAGHRDTLENALA